MNHPIVHFQTTDSTNIQAKRLAQEGAQHGTVVIAEEQTQGRGRFSRHFYSPSGQGIYLSILLRPDRQIPELGLITCASAVAVYRAIRLETGQDTQLKWVNDVYWHGKKICGILVESSVKNGQIDFLVVGIGINTAVTQFPKELEQKAGTLFVSDKQRLILTLLSEFDAIYQTLESREFMQDYIAHSMVIGKRVTLIKGSQEEKARVEGITQDGHLIVFTDQGEKKEISSGEISLKMEEGKLR